MSTPSWWPADRPHWMRTAVVAAVIIGVATIIVTIIVGRSGQGPMTQPPIPAGPTTSSMPTRASPTTPPTPTVPSPTPKQPGSPTPAEQPEPITEEQYLTELEAKDGSWNEGEISINGNTFGRGLYAKLGGCVREYADDYVLGRDWDRFSATVGLGDDSDSDSIALFEIFADKRRVFQEVIAYGKDEPVELSVENVLNLRLEVTIRQSEPGRCARSNRPAWGDPKVTRK